MTARYSATKFYFNPLPSCEGRLETVHKLTDTIKFQSTPLMRGETIPRNASRANRLISIHSPHARGDFLRVAYRSFSLIFQSTPLMRGETGFICGDIRFADHFNPLPS